MEVDKWSGRTEWKAQKHIHVGFFFSEMQKAEAIKKSDTLTASEYKLFVITMIL